MYNVNALVIHFLIWCHSFIYFYFSGKRLLIINHMIRKQMCSVLLLFCGSLSPLRYFLKLHQVSIAFSNISNSKLRGSNFFWYGYYSALSLKLQVPYDSMTPLQAALGVRQVWLPVCISRYIIEHIILHLEFLNGHYLKLHNFKWFYVFNDINFLFSP